MCVFISGVTLWIGGQRRSRSFVIALPTIGIFGLKLKRFPQFIGTIAFFVV